MSTEVRWRRGTSTDHTTFTGAAGEVTVDSTENKLVVHDGVTAGGHRAAKDQEVVKKSGALSELTDKPAAFANIKQDATTLATGVVSLATTAESQAGTDSVKALTPATLHAVTATDVRKGIIELATNTEAQAGTDTTRAVTPAALQAVTATETRKGIIELATEAEALAGTDTTRAVTPAGMAEVVKGYAEYSRPRKNHLINGGLDHWQRGTSFGSNAGFTADRWIQGGYQGSVTREAFTLGQTDVPGNPKYYFRKNRTDVDTQLNAIVAQRIEGVRTLAGKKATFSFYAKAATPKTIQIDVFQGFGTGGTPSAGVDVVGANIELTTAWQKFEVTIDVPSISGKTLGTDGNDRLEARFLESNNFSTYTIDIAQVQLEEGPTATDFEHRSIGEELALCQRYYEVAEFRQYIEATLNRGAIIATINFMQTKRGKPSVVPYSLATGTTGRVDVDVTPFLAFGGSGKNSGWAVWDDSTRTNGNAIKFGITADAEL